MHYVCSIRGRKQDLKILRYIETHLLKVKTIERRKCQAVVRIKHENRLYHVQIHLKGLRVNFFAQCKHPNIYQAIKASTTRIYRQVAKKREMVVQSRGAYRAKQKVS